MTSPSPQPALVLDTSVLIDLYHAHILIVTFRLPFRMLAPDVIIDELRADSGRQVVQDGAEVATFSPDEILRIEKLARKHRRVSVNDLFALHLAQRERAVLITGDGSLRALAESQDVAVHGVLWVLDELVNGGFLSQGEAANALRAMQSHKARLPHKEVLKRLAAWGP